MFDVQFKGQVHDLKPLPCQPASPTQVCKWIIRFMRCFIALAVNELKEKEKKKKRNCWLVSNFSVFSILLVFFFEEVGVIVESGWKLIILWTFIGFQLENVQRPRHWNTDLFISNNLWAWLVLLVEVIVLTLMLPQQIHFFIRYVFV